jgi:hypothetical protein
MQQLAGNGDLVDLGRPVGSTSTTGPWIMPKKGISLVTPRGPSTYVARLAMSYSTFCITTPAVAMSLRDALHPK